MAASIAADTVKPNDIKTLLGQGSSTFSLIAIQFVVMALKDYLRILLIFQFYAIGFFTILY